MSCLTTQHTPHHPTCTNCNRHLVLKGQCARLGDQLVPLGACALPPNEEGSSISTHSQYVWPKKACVCMVPLTLPLPTPPPPHQAATPSTLAHTTRTERGRPCVRVGGWLVSSLGVRVSCFEAPCWLGACQRRGKGGEHRFEALLCWPTSAPTHSSPPCLHTQTYAWDGARGCGCAWRAWVGGLVCLLFCWRLPRPSSQQQSTTLPRSKGHPQHHPHAHTNHPPTHNTFRHTQAPTLCAAVVVLLHFWCFLGSLPQAHTYMTPPLTNPPLPPSLPPSLHLHRHTHLSSSNNGSHQADRP